MLIYYNREEKSNYNKMYFYIKLIIKFWIMERVFVIRIVNYFIAAIETRLLRRFAPCNDRIVFLGGLKVLSPYEWG